jgi:hypothetical protein
VPRSWRKWWPLAVPLIALVELAAHVAFAHRAPTPTQWEQARPAVAAWYKAGEPVVIAPYWAEPMARWKWGDDLFPIRDVARPDVSRYAEALEVSTVGARSPELAGWPVLRQTTSGPFTLRTLKNPTPAAVTFDFSDHLTPAAAEVETVKGGSTTPCAYTETAPVESGGLGGAPTYPAARFRCSGEGDHVFVGLTVIDDEHAHPRQCIWSHPPGNGETVTRFRKVPLGSVIHAHAGRRWILERDHGGASFTVRVLVDGHEVGKMVHLDGDGWKAYELPLGADAHRTADVEFRSSGNTHACFEADSR